MEENNNEKKTDLIVPLTRRFYMELIKQAEESKKYRKMLGVYTVVLLIICVLLGCFAATTYYQKSQVEALKTQTELLKEKANILEMRLQQEQQQNFEEAQQHAQQEQANAYPLSDEEREAVQGVVMAEAGGQGYVGQVLVAQCIRNACEIDGISPITAIEEYKYATPKKAVSDEVIQAVADVFDNGIKCTEEPILYFYAPARVDSEWHENQNYVLTHGGHKFFARKG